MNKHKDIILWCRQKWHNTFE